MDNSWGSINLDDLCRVIESTVNTAMIHALERITPSPSPPGPLEPSGPAGEPGATVTSNGSSNPPTFSAREVGYFDPNPDVRLAKIKETHQIHYNVFSFTNRLKTCTVTMDPTLLRNNLPSCLIGKTERWYIEEISNITRLGLRNSSIDDWCELLERRFRDPPRISLIALERERYTIMDVR